jgi:hypothetical protein
MVDAAWLFGDVSRSDAQVVIVEEGAADDGQAASGSNGDGDGCGGSEQANPARGNNDGQTAAGGEEAQKAPKRRRDDDTQAAADNSNKQPEPAAKRSRAGSSSEGTVQLQIHQLIVMSASEFFKAKLSAWQGTNDEGEPCRVVLHVPPGQVELGRRFVRALYEAKPSFDDLGLEQQLQLLQLAQRYGAPKVVEAAAAAAGIDLALVAEKGLPWAAVQAAYSSSAGPPAAALRRYAADALQELFGDLEAVWATADAGAKKHDLLALPHAALKALLADERTRVASENAVVHTIVQWLAKNKLAPSSAQAEELLDLVSVGRLTPHYARTVFCESALAKAHLCKRERMLASAAPLVVGDDPAGLQDYEHWLLPARPRSALADALVLEWSPRLAEVEGLVTALPAEGGESPSVYGPKGVVWQGWPLQIEFDCTRDASGGVTLRFFLGVEPPCTDAVALIESTLEAVAAAGGSGIAESSGACLFTSARKMWCWCDFFGLSEPGDAADGGPPKDWAGVEAALRAQRLVHGGSGSAAHLKLRCTVSRLE